MIGDQGGSAPARVRIGNYRVFFFWYIKSPCLYDVSGPALRTYVRVHNTRPRRARGRY